MLNTMQEQIIFLRLMGYKEPEIEALATEAFPGQDFSAAWSATTRQIAIARSSVEAGISADDAAAVRAEHDTSVSMHTERQA